MGFIQPCEDAGGAVTNRDICSTGETMTYQKKTGALTPGAHAGSYNGQDAYSDMLITDKNGLLHRKRTIGSACDEREGRSIELHARSAGCFDRGGGMK